MSTLGRRSFRVVVIGAGQAGLSAGFYLRRAGLVAEDDYVVLDANAAPGGAWQHYWDSLRLFSPSAYSSLSGWPMPVWSDGFPPAEHVRSYLATYEKRYALPVHRPVTVSSVRRSEHGPGRYDVDTSDGSVSTDAVISATGTWDRPFWPAYPGQRDFAGRQLHTVDYRSPTDFADRRVVVVGGGNSAAQLLAEISTVTDATTWVTPRRPRFLPDDVDGRVLFDVATRRANALARGAADPGGVGGLGDIVMVPTVRAARDRGVLIPRPRFERLTPTGVAWSDGHEQEADVVLWCTGFRPSLGHLSGLHLPREDGHPVTDGTEAREAPGVHLLGYGDWTGPASATLIGVGRTARAAVDAVIRARDLGTRRDSTRQSGRTTAGG